MTQRMDAMSGSPLHRMNRIVQDVLHDPAIELTETTRLHDIHGCDSMDVVSIVVEAECRFGVLFALEDIEGLTTVGDVLRMIATKQAMVVA
jgi:acyl carrier protein